MRQPSVIRPTKRLNAAQRPHAREVRRQTAAPVGVGVLFANPCGISPDASAQVILVTIDHNDRRTIDERETKAHD